MSITNELQKFDKKNCETTLSKPIKEDECRDQKTLKECRNAIYEKNSEYYFCRSHTPAGIFKKCRPSSSRYKGLKTSKKGKCMNTQYLENIFKKNGEPSQTLQRRTQTATRKSYLQPLQLSKQLVPHL